MRPPLSRLLLALLAASPLLVLPVHVRAQDAAGGAARADAPPAPAADPVPAPPTPRWTLAPIRWFGRAGLEYRRVSFADQPSNSALVEDLTLAGQTYIWQPWFAQVTAGLGLVATQVSDSGQANSIGDTTGMTGNFGLSVFPSSRFPFQLSYDQSDSRSSGDFVGLDYRTQRIGLRQNYRTPSGQTAASFSADRSTIDADSFGRDRVDSVATEFSTGWAKQRVSFNASTSRNDRSDDDAGSRLMQYGASHSWRPDAPYYVDTLANVTRSELRLRTAQQQLVRFDSDFRQYSSFASYRPEDEHPLLVVGTLRVFDTRSAQGDGADSKSTSVGGTSAITYRHSDNLTSFGTFSASQLSAGEVDAAFYNESIGFNYMFDPRRLLGSTYTASTGASLGYSHGDIGEAESLASAQFAHSLVRPLAQGELTSLTLTAGQTLGAVHESRRGQSQTLVHTLGLSWRYSGREGGNGYASVTLGDSRSYGATESRFSLANLQLTGQWQFSQYASGAASFTAQYNQQSTSTTLPTDSNLFFVPPAQSSDNTNLSGSLSYQHVRAFNVPRLRFTSIYNAYNTGYSRLAGDPNAPLARVSWTFENRLDWFIGRLETRLGVRIAEIDGKKNALLFARINRSFGS